MFDHLTPRRPRRPLTTRPVPAHSRLFAFGAAAAIPAMLLGVLGGARLGRAAG